MPKHHKAQLDHRPFDWISAFDQIRADLETNRERILEIVGFYDEYEPTNDPVRAEQIKAEADGLISEIAAVLAKAAAIRIEAGFKPLRQLIATVRAVYRDPVLVTQRTIEDEALCVVARRYQRGDESPGTHWYDVTGDLAAAGTPLDIDLERVREAARVAIVELEGLASAARRRPRDVMGDYLALELGGIFNRFAGSITRHVIGGSYGESGRFKDLLELLLPALEAILLNYSTSSRPIRLSRDSLVGKAIKCHPGSKRRGRPSAR